jgi:hypothetical protein
MEKKKFRNMQTPFWKVTEGFIMIFSGLQMVLCLGLIDLDIWGRFMCWKLDKMFEEVK